MSTGRTLPTGVGAPALLEGLKMIGRVRPLPGHPQVSSIALVEPAAAVLARNSDLVDALNGASSSVKCHERPQLLGRAVQAHREATLTLRQLQGVERIVSRTAWGPAAFDDLDLDLDLDLEQRRRLRPAAMRLLTEAAPLDLDLAAWIRTTARALRDAAAELVDVPVCQAGHVLRSAAGQDQVVARDVFAPIRRTLLAQTVHDVKGRSRDAVLVVAQPRNSSRRPSQADTWTAHMRGSAPPFDQEEERRILFVALTRARRYAAIGLPSDTASATVDSFVRAGFVVSPLEPAQSRT